MPAVEMIEFLHSRPRISSNIATELAKCQPGTLLVALHFSARTEEPYTVTAHVPFLTLFRNRLSQKRVTSPDIFRPKRAAHPKYKRSDDDTDCLSNCS
jgi:hypothetical protein